MEARALVTVRSLLFLFLCFVPFVHGITYTMAEESLVDKFIGNVSADSGLRDQLGDEGFRGLRYSILSGGNQYSGLFKISSTTGVLTVGRRIDREVLCSFSDTCELNLEIAASSGSFVSNIKVKVIVTDVNDNSPSFPQQSVRLEVSEVVTLNFLLSLDAATDRDASANYSVQSYSLVPEDVPFRIVDSVNLVGTPQLSLVVSGQLDRETKASYSLTVWAYDGSQPPLSGSVSVTVTVLDVNDNPPVFSKPVFKTNISESTPKDTSILTVSATDKDSGVNAEIQYAISTKQPTQDQQKLSIGSVDGVVSVAKTLNVGTHRVLIEAQDKGSPPKLTQAVVEVTVLDTDNNPPVLNLDLLAVLGMAPGYVPESAKVSTAVAYLAVTDPDSGANQLVTCESRSDYFGLQPLNLDQYKVIVSSPLDRETTSYLNVLLVCHDGGSPRLTTTAAFDVWVVDVNDNPPVFLEPEYSASVAEGNELGDGLVQVAAADEDAGNNANITYRLLDAGDEFQISAATGMIKANHKFDYEKAKHYVFHVLAVDQGEQPLTATATVTINILDVNDEVPEFSAEKYNMSIVEQKEAGSYVGNISAYDPDTGPGGEVTLSIVPQPGFALPFELSNDGVLTTKNLLDREQRGVYTFNVMAKDRGRQSLSSIVLVTVIVLDVNDNDPVFVYPGESNSTEEIRIPVDAQFVVGIIRAIDADADQNGVVKYSVVGGNASNYFRIEADTGAIVTVADLKDSHIGTYHLVVRATDHGKPPRSTDRLLTLLVKREGAEKVVQSGSDSYVLIVVCIVVFTVVVSAAVLTTLCVLRKLDQDKKMKYSAACCPDGRTTEADLGGSLNSSTEFHQRLPTHSDGLDNKPMSESFSETHGPYGVRGNKGDAGSLNMVSHGMVGCPPQRSSNLRSSQLQLPLSNLQHGRQTPVQQLDLPGRRADDFHSTSSTETTTGDSGHGSDEDIPSHHHHHHYGHHLNHNSEKPVPSPSRIRLGVGAVTMATVPTGTPTFKDSSSSSSRPIFVQDGQFRRSKPRSSVRFSSEVTFDSANHAPQREGERGRGRFASNDSVKDDDSDLNTTTSGSYSVAPDDQFSDYRHLDFTQYSAVGRYAETANDMVV